MAWEGWAASPWASALVLSSLRPAPRRGAHSTGPQNPPCTMATQIPVGVSLCVCQLPAGGRGPSCSATPQGNGSHPRHGYPYFHAASEAAPHKRPMHRKECAASCPAQDGRAWMRCPARVVALPSGMATSRCMESPCVGPPRPLTPRKNPRHHARLCRGRSSDPYFWIISLNCARVVTFSNVLRCWRGQGADGVF